MLTDPVADMLTRIRNANKALHETTRMPSSKLKMEIARILKEEGYIRDYYVVKGGGTEELPYNVLVVELKYGRSRERVLNGVKRVSKPGRRIYASKDRLPARPWRHGNCNPVHVPRRDHEPHRRARRHRRRSDLFRLVTTHVSHRKKTH